MILYRGALNRIVSLWICTVGVRRCKFLFFVRWTRALMLERRDSIATTRTWSRQPRVLAWNTSNGGAWGPLTLCQTVLESKTRHHRTFMSTVSGDQMRTEKCFLLLVDCVACLGALMGRGLVPNATPYGPRCPMCSHMVSYGPRWFHYVPYGPIWLHMVPYGGTSRTWPPNPKYSLVMDCVHIVGWHSDYSGAQCVLVEGLSQHRQRSSLYMPIKSVCVVHGTIEAYHN